MQTDVSSNFRPLINSYFFFLIDTKFYYTVQLFTIQYALSLSLPPITTQHLSFMKFAKFTTIKIYNKLYTKNRAKYIAKCIKESYTSWLRSMKKQTNKQTNKLHNRLKKEEITDHFAFNSFSQPEEKKMYFSILIFS